MKDDYKLKQFSDYSAEFDELLVEAVEWIKKNKEHIFVHSIICYSDESA